MRRKENSNLYSKRIFNSPSSQRSHKGSIGRVNFFPEDVFKMSRREYELKHVTLSNENEVKFRAQILSQAVESFIEKDRVSLPDYMGILEKKILIKVLAHYDGNVKKSARFLGIKYTTLHGKLKKHQISINKHPVAS